MAVARGPAAIYSVLTMVSRNGYRRPYLIADGIVFATIISGESWGARRIFRRITTSCGDSILFDGRRPGDSMITTVMLTIFIIIVNRTGYQTPTTSLSGLETDCFNHNDNDNHSDNHNHNLKLNLNLRLAWPRPA